MNIFLRKLGTAVLAFFALSAHQALLAQNSPEQELQVRLRAAADAQQTGDASAIAQANEHLIAFTLNQLAEVFMVKGTPADAVNCYRQSLEVEDTSAVRLRYAFALMSAGQSDAALQESTHIVERDPKDAFAWAIQGRVLMLKQQYQKAAEALQRSLELQPDLENEYVLATALVKMHELEKVKSVFSQMEQAGLKPARVHVMAGRAYEQANLNADAEREYKQAIAIDPTSRGHYFLGLLYLTQNGWEPTDRARQEFTAEVAQNPTDFFGNYFLGYLGSVGKDYDASDRYLEVAAAAQPNWPEPYLYLGLNAYGRGDDRKAEQFLRKAIELTGNDESRNNYQIRRAYFTLGRILIQAGNKEEGKKYTERSREIETKLVVEARPQALDAKAAEGNSQPGAMGPQASSQSPEQASATAAAQKELSTVLGTAYNDLGSSKARLHDYASALAAFSEAEHWAPETPGLLRNLGMAAFLSGNYAESSRALQGVLKKDANDHLASAMLAMSWYSLGNYDKAAQQFDQVGDENISDPRMNYARAKSLIETKNPTAAAKVLDRMISHPVPSEILVEVSELYAKMGDQTNAKKCLDLARQVDPAVQTPQ
jgi:tetratricopeptide (TPR) repeat protein